MADSKREFEELLKRLAAPPSSERLRPGSVVEHRYRILRIIGEGGMGEVYAAEHLKSGEHVALKCLKPALGGDRDCLSRFYAEARAAARIGHPNIIDVQDTGVLDDGRPFLCMELIDGPTLQTELDQARIESRRLVRMARQLCSALAAAHRHGIIHRDLKPANVFLVPNAGEQDYVKLGDFGVARMIMDADHRLTSSGIVLGTPHFMAPEQATGDRSADHRVDIYAVGVLLYYCAAGRLPFDARTFSELVVTICTSTPTRVASLCPDIDRSLASVIEVAMARHPDQRFQSMDALSAALSRT